jgi:Fe-S cluster biogenesis protein NfuA
MAQNTSLQKQIQRIGELVGQIEASADPNALALARELLESLMALHGAGLEQILKLAGEAGEEGKTLVRKFGHDELVSALLILYGLHPENLQSRVAGALASSRAYLESHAARAELLAISADGTVTLRLHQKPNGCGSTAAALKSTLEAAVLNAAPDATSIVVEEVGVAAGGSGFVPLEQLAGNKVMAASVIMQAQGSGD